MNSIKMAGMALLGLSISIPVTIKPTQADSADAIVGALVGGAIGGYVTNNFFNNRRHEYRHDYYDRPNRGYYRNNWRRGISAETKEGIKVQQALAANGFYNASFNGNLESYESRSAIMQYQQRYGLPTTGTLQDDVKNLLVFQGESAVLSNYLNYLGYERRDKARRIQAALKILGFYTKSIDGVLGRNSQDAIRLYQQSKEMTISGALMPADEDELVSDAKAKLQEQNEQVEEHLRQKSGQNKT